MTSADREMVLRLAREVHEDPGEIGPELEALAFVLAASVGLTDDIGGTEWCHRVERGDVSDGAVDVLRSIGVDVGDEKGAA